MLDDLDSRDFSLDFHFSLSGWFWYQAIWAHRSVPPAQEEAELVVEEEEEEDNGDDGEDKEAQRGGAAAEEDGGRRCIAVDTRSVREEVLPPRFVYSIVWFCGHCVVFSCGSCVLYAYLISLSMLYDLDSSDFSLDFHFRFLDDFGIKWLSPSILSPAQEEAELVVEEEEEGEEEDDDDDEEEGEEEEDDDDEEDKEAQRGGAAAGEDGGTLSSTGHTG